MRPEKWNLNWSPPAVSEFSGALTYNYPIETPPGRNGLQPSVALFYSSRSIDGALASLDDGVLAPGWSIAEISIIRTDIDYGHEWRLA